MSSKSLEELGRWHQGGECVFVCVCGCARGIRIKESVNVCASVCVAISWLASLCLCLCWELWVLRAMSGPLPPPGPPGAYLQATVEPPQLPPSSCRSLVLPQRHREKASVGVTGTYPRSPTWFIRTFIYYHHYYYYCCWWRNCCSLQCVNAEGRSWIWIYESNPASVHTGDTSLELLERGSPGHENRNESTAI